MRAPQPICRIVVALAIAWLPATLAAGTSRTGPNVDFQRDVRPILSQHCFKCHGMDEQARKAKLRLDVRESALAALKSGEHAIVAGHPDESELVRRIFSADEKEVMPPPSAKLPLSEAQRQVLKKWIASGAEYTRHWAFVPPRQAALPKVKQGRWPRNEIDYFVLARLEHEGMKPSPRADRPTLIRRLYLDLIGLPPLPEEVNAFIADKSDDAYERLVDRLLASSHYGERWARRWLDLARYADTNGYEKDRQRSIWPYRDWVINALNADRPFDRFTVEQVAGDLLPRATLEDRVATGFHRNTMLNEEGGIDPLEFRFYSMVDRVATTGKTWLGLTLQCAQCHTHKYDPVPQREYYQLMAFLDDADEPEIDLPDPGIAAKQRDMERHLDELVVALPDKFPVPGVDWSTPRPCGVTSVNSGNGEVRDDSSVTFTNKPPEKDTYTAVLDVQVDGADRLRLEVIPDEKLPRNGPGRAADGNFVLSEISVLAAPLADPDTTTPVKLISAEADYSQPGFPVENAFDGRESTGWAIANADKPTSVQRTAVFRFAGPVMQSGGTRFTIRLEQQHGKQYLLGRFRLSVGRPIIDPRPIEVRRRERIDTEYSRWLARERSLAVQWQPLHPVSAKSNLPLLTAQPDDSVLASGDTTKSDIYELTFANLPRRVTAVRLEVLPDDRLPGHGPGLTFYEGPKGDFFLGEFQLFAAGQQVRFCKATESYAKNNFGSSPVSAALATDGDPQTGWSCAGRYGERHEAVFNLQEPLDAAGELQLKMLFGRHYAASLGRFRISVTTDSRVAEARDLPAAIERLLLIPDAQLTDAQRQQLRQQSLLVAPELAAARAEIEKLRAQMPAYPTTLVMQERPPNHPRPTFIHHRGEYLQPTERVEPAVLSVLNPLPKGAPPNRLSFARWLVSPDNPLTARVVMNRQWAAFFGRGIVSTVDDFGFQGSLPTHPELLDWLAVEFVKQGWSLKKMHKLIVMSATYQQSSRATPERLAKDKENELLGRGPRVRLEAELVRDSALQIAGLLSEKIGGPSVFPPQPASVTTEGTYGKLDWKTSEGADRYRRGLYTFSKRTTPYAMFATFDAPSGEDCIAKRDVSNSPLQALTMLNDTVLVEASQALGRLMTARTGADQARVDYLFRRFFARPPAKAELQSLVTFYRRQKQRFEQHELDAAALAGNGEGDVNERAAWTALARALFNLDEAITKG